MLTPDSLFLTMTATLFFLGAGTFVTGVLKLALSTANKEVQELATQAARLAQKSVAEDAAGLVGRASELLEAANQMVRTPRGVGMFLTLFGAAMMGCACWLAYLIFQSVLR